jgi:pimeloyl-ACP methyl ester carboxylesterase
MSAARVALLPLLLAALAAPAPAAAHAPPSSACPAPRVARCFSLSVPLDRSGVVPGRVRLRAARIRSRAAARPPLIGLTGGPGQAGVTFAETFDILLPSARRDLVVFDQRGTGASGLLRCRVLERAPTNFSSPAGACGRSLGARRSFYTSADSAEDLEALRVRLGAPRMALYAISYGTRVAVDYARRYPQRVERMVLDSPIGLGAPDPLARETLGAIRRVLRSACRGGACGPAGARPLADIAALRARLRRAPIRRRGRAPVRINADDLLTMIISADVDPELMRAIPAAVRAALGGRSGPLVRLKRALLSVNDRGPISEFSPALFVTTTCEESPPAWDPAADPATRRIQAQAAADATPLAALYPFDRAAALAAGLLPLCADWPAPARAIAPAPPLPARVPALVLAGELDLRTPLEKARELARALPAARLLVERGVGHGVVGALPGGCADGALQAFLDRRPLPRCRRGDAALTLSAAASDHATQARTRPPAGPAAPPGQLPR